MPNCAGAHHFLGISALPPETFWNFLFTVWHFDIPTLPPAR